MPMTQDLTNLSNNISVRSNKLAGSSIQNIEQQKVKLSTKYPGAKPVGHSTRGISPSY